MEVRKNKNKGCQKLTVWKDAIEYYVQTRWIFEEFPWDLKRVLVESREEKRGRGRGFYEQASQ